MTGKREPDERELWPAKGGHGAGVGLSFLPAAPGARRPVRVATISEPLLETTEPDMTDTEELEPLPPEALKKRGSSLADRVSRPKRTKSALDLVREDAVASKAPRASVPKHHAQGGQPTEFGRPPVSLVEPGLGDLLQKTIGKCHVNRQLSVGDASVFSALWASHKARALASHDVQLAIAADLITRTAEEHGIGSLRALEVEFVGEIYLVWVDLNRHAVLAMLCPAEVYMTGLSSPG